MRRLALVLVLAMASCYSPSPKDGSFTCDADHGFLCPSGLLCDRAANLCVHALSMDLGAPDLISPYDLTPVPIAPTCDTLVQAGAFAHLTNLGAVNGAGDEHSLTVSADNSRIYFLDGAGALQTSALSGKSAAAPQAVTVSGTGPTIPDTFFGGTLASDGKYWFLGASSTGPSAGLVSLFTATLNSATDLAVTASHSPSAMACPLTDPVFAKNDSGSELYVAFPLGGCANGSMIAQGNADKNMGAFIGAVAQKNVAAPTLTPSGNTLLMSTTGTSGRLQFATRASMNDQWHGPSPLPLSQSGSIGVPAQRDVQALVSADCKTLFLVADRAGGHGGLDLWAADIVWP